MPNALLEFKRDRVGVIRLSDIENRLLRFCNACEGKTMAQITGDDINPGIFPAKGLTMREIQSFLLHASCVLSHAA